MHEVVHKGKVGVEGLQTRALGVLIQVDKSDDMDYRVERKIAPLRVTKVLDPL